MMNSRKFITFAGALMAALISTSCLSSEGAAKVEDAGKVQMTTQFHQACKSDTEKFCSDVQPGDGRISACLYARTDVLEDSCYKATTRIGMVLESVFDGIESFHAACGADLNKFCQGVPAGAGGLIGCLKKNIAEVSAGCAVAIPGS
jgi:hypothetical protein